MLCLWMCVMRCRDNLTCTKSIYKSRPCNVIIKLGERKYKISKINPKKFTSLTSRHLFVQCATFIDYKELQPFIANPHSKTNTIIILQKKKRETTNKTT